MNTLLLESLDPRLAPDFIEQICADLSPNKRTNINGYRTKRIHELLVYKFGGQAGNGNASYYEEIQTTCNHLPLNLHY